MLKLLEFDLVHHAYKVLFCRPHLMCAQEQLVLEIIPGSDIRGSFRRTMGVEAAGYTVHMSGDIHREKKASSWGSKGDPVLVCGMVFMQVLS